MKKIFISSAYSIGDQAENVKRQIDTANLLLDLGFAPYTPLLCHFLHLHQPRDYDTWLKLDIEYLKCCDAVLRLPSESMGADLEVKEAKRLGIPVYYSVDLLERQFI
jgi:hypothetical protein